MTYPVMKEFHRLVRRMDKLTDGQACMGEISWEDNCLDEFVVFIMPKGGYYEGGKFKFSITIPITYPCDNPPTVWCHTPIYHPNIDPTDSYREHGMTNVCLNILSSDWDPSIGLEGVVLGLIFLLYNPNEEDALSPVFDSADSNEEFAEKVRQSLAGDEVDGFYYEANNCNEKEVEKEGDAVNTDAKVCEGGEAGGDVVVNADMNVNDEAGHDGLVGVTADTNDDVNEDRVDAATDAAETVEVATESKDQDIATNRRVAGEEEIFREMMAKDLDDVDELNVGLVIVDGEYGLVLGAGDSGVNILDDREGQNEDACLIETNKGEYTEDSTIVKDAEQHNNAEVESEASVSADLSVNDKNEIKDECLAVTAQEAPTSDENSVLHNEEALVVTNEPDESVDENNVEQKGDNDVTGGGLTDKSNETSMDGRRVTGHGASGGDAEIPVVDDKTDESRPGVVDKTDEPRLVVDDKTDESRPGVVDKTDEPRLVVDDKTDESRLVVDDKTDESRQVPQSNSKLRTVRNVITATILGVWIRHGRY